MFETHEGSSQFEHSLDHAVEFFSKAGSLFVNKGTFYGGEESALSLFQQTWIVEPDISMRLLFWLRDPRGGAGNRSGARACWNWLAAHDPNWASSNLHMLPKYGRWDDLRALFGTELEHTAALTWANALRQDDLLAAKWADRTDFPVRKILEMKVGPFRRFLANLRKNGIVEHQMCTLQWEKIDYEKVPSVAMSRYASAFKRHDDDGFTLFKEAVKSGEASIKAAVLFPHDCVRTALQGDKETADLQFDALPNYMPPDEKALCLCDSSGSMNAACAGSSIQRVHVSMALALYCSAKMPEDSPFYKKFIKFESEDKLVSWEDQSFSQALGNREIFDGAVGATRLDKALITILRTAQMFKVPPENMPGTLIIVSDMQFTNPDGIRGRLGQGGVNNGCLPVVKQCMQDWEKAGYTAPKIVYWNVAGYAGGPELATTPNTGLVSGFSPAILKAVFAGEDFTPRGIMERAISQYEIVIP